MRTFCLGHSTLALALALAAAGPAPAATVTVAGVTFDIDNSVTAASISTTGTLSHSFFTANVNGNLSPVDPDDHVGALLGGGASAAVDMTNGTNGAAGRNFITLTWGGNRVENQPGDDLFVFESGAVNSPTQAFPEAFGVAVRAEGASAFSPFRYEFFDEGDVVALKLVTRYDLSAFGIPEGNFIDAVQVISLHNASATTPPNLEDRVDGASGEGNLTLDAGSSTGFALQQGPNSGNPGTFPDNAMDADIVYVVATNVQPPPVTAAQGWELYH